jgi:hypothetical protein
MLSEKEKTYQLMLATLRECDELFENLWKAVDWGRSFDLDVAALNRVPDLVKRVIKQAGEVKDAACD